MLCAALKPMLVHRCRVHLTHVTHKGAAFPFETRTVLHLRSSFLQLLAQCSTCYTSLASWPESTLSCAQYMLCALKVSIVTLFDCFLQCQLHLYALSLHANIFVRFLLRLRFLNCFNL